jgi:hypothetical protein
MAVVKDGYSLALKAHSAAALAEAGGDDDAMKMMFQAAMMFGGAKATAAPAPAPARPAISTNGTPRGT